MINNTIKLSNEFEKCEELFKELKEVYDAREALKSVEAYDEEHHVLNWSLGGDHYFAKEFNRLIIKYVMESTTED